MSVLKRKGRRSPGLMPHPAVASVPATGPSAGGIDEPDACYVGMAAAAAVRLEEVRDRRKRGELAAAAAVRLQEVRDRRRRAELAAAAAMRFPPEPIVETVDWSAAQPTVAAPTDAVTMGQAAAAAAPSSQRRAEKKPRLERMPKKQEAAAAAKGAFEDLGADEYILIARRVTEAFDAPPDIILDRCLRMINALMHVIVQSYHLKWKNEREGFQRTIATLRADLEKVVEHRDQAAEERNQALERLADCCSELEALRAKMHVSAGHVLSMRQTVMEQKRVIRELRGEIKGLQGAFEEALALIDSGVVGATSRVSDAASRAASSGHSKGSR